MILLEEVLSGKDGPFATNLFDLLEGVGYGSLGLFVLEEFGLPLKSIPGAPGFVGRLFFRVTVVLDAGLSGAAVVEGFFIIKIGQINIFI